MCVCVICAIRCTCQQIDTNPGLDQPRKGTMSIYKHPGIDQPRKGTMSIYKHPGLDQPRKGTMSIGPKRGVGLHIPGIRTRSEMRCGEPREQSSETSSRRVCDPEKLQGPKRG